MRYEITSSALGMCHRRRAAPSYIHSVAGLRLRSQSHHRDLAIPEPRAASASPGHDVSFKLIAAQIDT